MATYSSSLYISNLVKIHHENHNALRFRLSPSLVRDTSDSGLKRTKFSVRAEANLVSPNWDAWKPDMGSKAPSLSDIFWPSAGAFAAMAVLGKMDHMLAKKGVSMTIAPLGAVCAVLFATPSTPGARKYNMFMAQMGCAAIGVFAFSIFGPGWLSRSVALSASLAFMIYTRSVHPPAASLPLLFIDVVKFHHLKFWYILFPGAAGCLLLCLIQEVVCYLKDNVKF
uniref:transmembrane protein DDB_G0273707/DDB_G0273361-like n=1 Tax=Erigeron canadensis TaxID=72917 RepID=UPI001CB8F0B2|nr:transmembrane protein DDB_G0273707/DDB_G0273361-like [Erigeron canadensis]